MRYFRKIRPTGVIRNSLEAFVAIEISPDDAGRIVRSFTMLNGWPARPTRD